jgi:hypothetical protein
VVLSIFSPRSGIPADPSSDCRADPSVLFVKAGLADDAECAELAAGSSGGRLVGVGAQQHADFHDVSCAFCFTLLMPVRPSSDAKGVVGGDEKKLDWRTLTSCA